MPFHDCVLRERTIEVPTYNKAQQCALVYNITTDTQYPIRFQDMFNLKHNSLDEKFARELLQYSDIQWGNRRVARVVENNFAYFAVKRISESRNLNLFNKRMQREICD
jgi:hypothetical protein